MSKKVEFNIETVKKYIFWVCTPIGLVIAVLAGFLAIGSVASDLNQQKQHLESQKSAMTQLRSGAATHPNQGTIDAINEVRWELVENVLAAWEILVQEQQARNQWGALAERAIQELTSKNFLDPLESTTLDSYLEFAKDTIDGNTQRGTLGLLDATKEGDAPLRRVQQYRLQPDGQLRPVETILLTESRGGRGGSGGFDMGSRGARGGAASSPMTPQVAGPTTLTGKVVWDNPDLDFTLKNWSQRPRAFEVWLTQEDLWVYQALLWVIAESNRDKREDRVNIMPGAASQGTSGGRGDSGGGGGTGAATRPLNLSDSAVKEIIDISIGINAAIELSRQSSRRVGFSGLGMGMSDGSSGMDMGMSGGMGSTFGAGGRFGSFGDSGGGSDMMGTGAGMTAAAAAEAARSAAMMGRYVDETGTPLMEPDLTGQFRRMPVYLNLRVDQRYLSDVLVNCANSPMPIDVLWVTVNPDATQPFDFAPAVGTGMGSEMGRGGSSFGGSGGGATRRTGAAPGSMGGGSMSRGSAGGGTRTAGNVDFGPHQVIVEIFGCINIFAPPDPRTLENES